MMFSPKSKRGLPVSAAIVAAFSVFALQGAFAQSQDSDVVVMERYEVTGSYIPVAGTSSAIPVTTLTAGAIEDTGISTNVLEVLRKIAPQFAGNSNLGNTNSNIGSGSSGGGSQLAFRNTQTLVLINGRRSAYAPILASGGFQFVDVNLIPIAAIEKIEILQDGASAIYGTDAVAGVVNVILKSDYEGMEIGARYGFSDNDGNYAERKAWVVGGGGNETTRVTVSGEWTKTDPLYQYEREFSNPSYGTATFGGIVNTLPGAYYVLTPSLNAPPMNQDLTMAQLVANGTYIGPVNASNLISGLGNEQQYSFNLSQYVTLLIANERRGATVAFEHKLGDNAKVFADLMYSSTDTFSQINAQPTAAVIAAGDPFNPSNETLVVRNRFLSKARQYYYETSNLRGVIGAKGSFNDDWRWEIGALNNRIKQDYKNEGVIDTAARGVAVSTGLLNYFAREQADGAVENSGMFGTALGIAVSTLATADARVSGRLFDLPAGEVGFAAGVEHRREKLTQTADRNSQANTFGWDSATTLDPFTASRTVEAGFVNVRVPVLGDADGEGMRLIAEGALRYEKYSDTDDPSVPKISLAFWPRDNQFMVRGTYSESFAAPTLPNLFGPGGIGFTSSLSLARFGGGNNITGQANSRSGSNPDLKPSTSENYTVGFIWSPKSVRGFSVSVDYFDIKQDELISSIGSATILQDVELNGTSSPYASFVRLGATSNDTTQFTQGAPITAAGQIGNRAIDTVYVTDTLVNIALQKLSGFDVKVTYVWNTDTWGTFDASLAGIWWNEYAAQTLPGTDEFDTVGQATSYNGTIPDYQTYLGVNWQKNNWGATFGWTYIPSVDDVNWYDDTDSRADEHVEAFNSVDLSVRYSFAENSRWFNGMTVRLGVNNVFNESPPSALGTFTEANADTATYGAVGRFMFIEAKYKF